MSVQYKIDLFAELNVLQWPMACILLWTRDFTKNFAILKVVIRRCYPGRAEILQGRHGQLRLEWVNIAFFQDFD